MPFSLTAFFRCAALAIAAAMAAAPVAAQQGFAALVGRPIAAVVNDQIISTYDLDARLRLGLFSANLPATPENPQRLLPQALRQLVDARRQMQEAQRLNVTVSDDEMAEA
ncbi:MAG: SurA N-terminal domain-containing protein, partial [Alphaproteobacteria bacterium]